MSTVTNVVNGVITNQARANLAAYLTGNPPIQGTDLGTLSFFRIGEGGSIDSPAGPVPRIPDPSLTDLDIILDGSRPTSSQRYPGLPAAGGTGYFQKSFVAGTDFSLLASPITGLDSIFQGDCTMLTTDFNADPTNPPILWEIGMYDTNSVMVFYGTFVGQTKNSSFSLVSVCNLVC